ncbi:hypothetical protein B0H14DRAFT_3423201 [Mycena olivaceomarginata]|nr:hypothetical protein B0H14DRAFT_3423201 [Mycena olivaceomarginata]
MSRPSAPSTSSGLSGAAASSTSAAPAAALTVANLVRAARARHDVEVIDVDADTDGQGGSVNGCQWQPVEPVEEGTIYVA